jgi:hypothetical protein
VGSVLLEETNFEFAHPHTHTMLQQQQGVVVALGIIVIADLLYRCQLS